MRTDVETLADAWPLQRSPTMVGPLQGRDNDCGECGCNSDDDSAAAVDDDPTMRMLLLMMMMMEE